jgi:hypothetical protein
MVIDYQELEAEVFHLLVGSSIKVMVAGNDNKVTLQCLSCLLRHKKIYLQPKEDFINYGRTVYYPNVAMRVNNIQLEGVGHTGKYPQDKPENKELYLSRGEGVQDVALSRGEEVVIEVEPTFVSLWKYEDGHTLRDFLDLRKKEAYREIYDMPD